MSKSLDVNARQQDFVRGAIEGVVVRDITKFVDERGWLAEIFRHDELLAECHPQMAYISVSEPHATRGPHEHVNQSDFFCFIGPANFKLRMWDNRPDSATRGYVMTLFVGEDNPKVVSIPPGVAHAYRNISATRGIVINCPNRLFMGAGKQEPVDEIRHEDDPTTPFRIED